MTSRSTATFNLSKYRNQLLSEMPAMFTLICVLFFMLAGFLAGWDVDERHFYYLGVSQDPKEVLLCKREMDDGYKNYACPSGDNERSDEKGYEFYMKILEQRGASYTVMIFNKASGRAITLRPPDTLDEDLPQLKVVPEEPSCLSNQILAMRMSRKSEYFTQVNNDRDYAPVFLDGEQFCKQQTSGRKACILKMLNDSIRYIKADTKLNQDEVGFTDVVYLLRTKEMMFPASYAMDWTNLHLKFQSIASYDRVSRLHERFKRSSASAANPPDIMAVFQSNCTIKCSEQLDRDFNKTYPANKNSTKVSSNNQAVSQVAANHYSEEDLDTLCKTYLPSSKCIKACPSYEFIKPMMLDMLTMLEYMCVTNNKDMKQQMPCIAKHEKELDGQCDPKCSKYEPAVDQVLEKSNLQDVNDKTIKIMQKNFNDSCTYMKCVDKCQTPLIEKLCGSAAAKTAENLFLATFHSIKSILSSVNMVRSANATTSLVLVCDGLPKDPF